MKRWIHAKSDATNIDYKMKDYIAAWAKDDAKNGQPVATYTEFEDEMKSKGFKVDKDRYDYYIACYNNACKKPVKAAYDYDSDEEYISYEEAEYDMGFMDIENEVIDELGLYIDFSSVRYNDGPIWIFSDPDHENDADMWMGDIDEAIAELDFSEYSYGVESEVLRYPQEEWKDRYTAYLQSLI